MSFADEGLLCLSDEGCQALRESLALLSFFIFSVLLASARVDATRPCRVSQHDSMEPCPLPPSLSTFGSWRRRLHACVSHHNLMGPCPLPPWRRRLHALTRVTARLDRVMPIAAVTALGGWRWRLHALLCVMARLERAMPIAADTALMWLVASLARLVACHSAAR